MSAVRLEKRATGFREPNPPDQGRVDGRDARPPHVWGGSDSRSRSRARRGGFIAGIALFSFLVVALFLVVFARFALVQFDRERSAMLASRGEQALLGARDWCARNGREIAVGAAKELPLADLLPELTAGTLTLRRVTDAAGVDGIECHLRLRCGKATYRRSATWAVPIMQPATATAPTSGLVPASAPANPAP